MSDSVVLEIDRELARVRVSNQPGWVFIKPEWVSRIEIGDVLPNEARR